MPNSETLASPEAEQSVLGAVLVSPEKLTDIIDELSPGDFFYSKNAAIYQAMIDLVRDDIAVDSTNVLIRLKEKGEHEKIGGAVYLAGLSEECGFSTNARHYSQKIMDYAVLRRLVVAGRSLINNCQNGGKTKLSELIEAHKQEIDVIADGAKTKGGKNITKKIRSWVEGTEGNFEVTRVQKELGLVTDSNKKAVKTALSRLTKEGVLARIKPGIYRVTANEVQILKLSDAAMVGEEIPMKYPLGFEKWFITYPKTVVLFAGEPDAGKTAMLLNVAKLNMHLGPIRYWTSEMGLSELYSRVSKIEGFNIKEWDEKVVFAERDADFEDVVKLYPDAIHIIDNLEVHEDFWIVGGLIDKIWKALDRGVAVIGLHKDPAKKYGSGGMASVKRPRLVVELKGKRGGGNIAEVTKAKNWRDQHTNIKGKQIEFYLVGGNKIIEWE